METSSKFAAALTHTHWQWVEPKPETTTKAMELLRCKCGNKKRVRVADVIAGKSNSCRVCAMVNRNKTHSNPKHLKTISSLGTQAMRRTHESFYASIGISQPQWKRLISIMRGARQRCQNPNDTGYKNYGGRGVKFNFPDTRAAALWVWENLGMPPEGHSIDRIDNNGHYEPGNLRWADRATQNSNKRRYKRSKIGERIRALQSAGSQYSYESLRGFIQAGLSDDQILTKVKYAHPSL